MTPTRASEIEKTGVVEEPIYEPIPSEQRKKQGRLYNYTIQYWGRKPWNVVRRYIQHFAPEPDSLVADPYAGAGVTIGESLRTRCRAIGLDIQPLSELINRSIIAQASPFQVWDAAERIKAAVHPLVTQLKGPAGVEAAQEYLQGEDLSFLQLSPPRYIQRRGAQTYLETFDPRHLAGLLATRNAIETESGGELRPIMWLAFANLLRYANRGYEGKRGKGGKLEKWRGDHVIFKWKRLGAVDRFTYIDFGEILDHCLERVYRLKDITELEFGDYIRSGEKAWFFRDDASRLSHYVMNVVGAGELDYVLMDPPYSDLIHYAALATYWNIWLPDDLALTALPLESTLQHGKDAFAARLSDSISDAASVLKIGGWLTLFYLDIWDFSLWHRILEEASEARLEHVNSTWNPQQIPSATQIQNPLSGIRGAVIANFRRVRSRVRPLGGTGKKVRPIETPLVYLEHQLQRIILENLGATTSEILSHLSDEIYTRVSLAYFTEEEMQSVPALLKDIGARELSALQPVGADVPPLWVLREDIRLDPEADPYDMLRYQLFVELARRGEASTADLLRSVYEGGAPVRPEDLRDLSAAALLSTFAEPLSAMARERGGWRINWRTRFKDVQLRLLLSTTTAHRLREAIQRTQPSPTKPLHINIDGLSQLAHAGPDGPTGATWQQISRGVHLLGTTVRDSLGDVIHSVWAVREFAAGEWDADEPEYDDLPLLIMLRDGIGDPVGIEDQLLENLFGRLYKETRLNFLPYFRVEDDPDIEVLFGCEDERVLLIGDASLPGARRSAAS